MSDRPTEIRNMLDQAVKAKGGYYDRELILKKYALERYIYRVSKSVHADKFVLKGAMLLAVYVPDANRPSKDADFQVYGIFSPTELKNVISEICEFQFDDGLVFDKNSIKITDNGTNRTYPGYTVKMTASLGATPCSVQLDIGFGDTISPLLTFRFDSVS